MPKLRIRAERVEAAHLSPGDFYSDKGPEYWNEVASGVFSEFGAEVFVRADTGLPVEMKDKTVYKITVTGTVRDINSAKLRFTMDPHSPPGVKDPLR